MLHPLSDKITTIPGHYKKSVLKSIELLLSAILVSRTVNLNKVKDDLPNVLNNSDLKPESYYKKLIRCVETCAPSRIWIDLLRWAVSHIWGNIDTLHIDGTEWNFGSYAIHVLVLTADFQGVAVPIFFKIYRHEGVLSESTRIAFMKKALLYYDLRGKVLLADREFIGTLWFQFLDAQGINFIIRLRKKMYKSKVNELNIDAELYEKCAKKALKKGYAQAIICLGNQVFRIEFWKNKHHEESIKDPIIFLITNILDRNRVGKKYQQRWKIEHCFKQLKSNGFDIEDIGFKKIHKIQFIIAIVIVLYILAVCKGIICDKKNKLKSKNKKYKSGVIGRATSIFRQGLFQLKATISNVFQMRKFLATLQPKKNSLFKSVQ
jgi:Transposase DDE domain